MLQAISRTKGRLSIDYRKQDMEPQQNPYLGLHLIAHQKIIPRNKEVEPMVAAPNFRKLKQSSKDSNYCSSSVSGSDGKKHITNTIDLIQQSKERVKEKRLQKEQLAKVSEAEKEEEALADLREGQYRIRFSHIQT
jgi:hypothetical protein